MKVNMTIDTRSLTVDDIAKLVVSVDCSSRHDCNKCPFLSPTVLKNDKVETTCMSLFINTQVNVNKL